MRKLLIAVLLSFGLIASAQAFNVGLPPGFSVAYDVVRAQGKAAFVHAMNVAIDNGCRPVGGVSVTQGTGGFRFFAQAVTCIVEDE